jgi:phosphopantothenoylcysteine decarboxylase/phosphopantothenate--cysteine ligase
MKKTEDGSDLTLELERTDDILAYLGAHKKQGQFLCGFAMETEDLIANAKRKLEKKRLDMIAANSLRVEGAGFGGNTNVVTVITKEKEVSFGKMTKEETAAELLTMIAEARKV